MDLPLPLALVSKIRPSSRRNNIARGVAGKLKVHHTKLTSFLELGVRSYQRLQFAINAQHWWIICIKVQIRGMMLYTKND